MIATTFFFFYFVFFLIKEKAYYYIYNFAVLLFGVFICAKLEPSSCFLIYHIFPIGMFLPLLPYLRKYLTFFLVSIGILVFYVIFKYAIWHIGIMRMFMDLRISIFAVCMALSMIENIRHGHLNINLLVKGIYILVLVQIILAIVQYLIPSLSDFFVVLDDDATSEANGLSLKLNMNLLTGTLITPSALSGFFVVSLFVLMIYELENKSVSFLKIIFALVTIGVTFLSGIRTPFIFLLLFLSIYLFFRQKKLFFSLLPVLSILIIVIFTSTTISQEGAVGRMFEGFTQVLQGKKGLEESTLGYSFLMFPYFIQNPIFGVSLGADNYSLLGGYVLSDMSVSDVYLLYILCEYGLIGLGLYLYPFFILKRLSSKGKSNYCLEIKQSTVLLFVLFGVCLTIVDKGIFHYLEVSLLVTGIVLYSDIKSKKLDVILEKNHKSRL